MTRRPSRRMRLLLMKRVERRKFRKWIATEMQPLRCAQKSGDFRKAAQEWAEHEQAVSS